MRGDQWRPLEGSSVRVRFVYLGRRQVCFSRYTTRHCAVGSTVTYPQGPCLRYVRMLLGFFLVHVQPVEASGPKLVEDDHYILKRQEQQQRLGKAWLNFTTVVVAWIVSYPTIVPSRTAVLSRLNLAVGIWCIIVHYPSFEESET